MKRLILMIALVILVTASVYQLQSAANATVFTPKIVKLDDRFDKIVPAGAVLEKVAEGFAWAEGPVWSSREQALLFSDVPNNRIIKWKAGSGSSTFLEPSGYTGKTPFTGREPGSNGHNGRPEYRVTTSGSVLLRDTHLDPHTFGPCDPSMD